MEEHVVNWSEMGRYAIPARDGETLWNYQPCFNRQSIPSRSVIIAWTDKDCWLSQDLA